ncbi:glycoside hydrolase [Clostridium gasigenes]|uniref:glycoside hydrolase n=1 Tax=Clostridium gasigenes TaxID=94869 RepID=UPI001C0C7F9C|nr:glycoside hydrolase [Clostridium gasigenes]MBU3108289.1 glycoside hydrolase [Clostridium gasigenes]
MKKIIVLLITIGLASNMMVSCKNKELKAKSDVKVKNLEFNFEVDPETFEITTESNGVKENAAQPLEKREVSNLKKSKEEVTWTYPNDNIDVKVQKKDNYLDVKIRSNTKEESEFSWPRVNAESYMLPINEGKYIPSDDEYWKEHLTGSEYNVIESFSMQFFALNKKAYSIMYIIENSFNNKIKFEVNDKISFGFTHEYPSINKNKEYGFKIYLTENNPVDIAKTYKNYVVEKGDFKTLEEKEKDNKDIAKLYGAPHMYFWDRSIISEENIKWDLLRKNLSPKLKERIKELLKTKVEGGEEFVRAFDDVTTLEFADKYTKSLIVRSINSIGLLKELYSPDVFKNIDEETNNILSKGIDNLNKMELIELNKRLLKSELGDIAEPIENWGNSKTTDVLEDINKSGIEKMWIGLDDWNEGFIKPKLVEKANELGYLIGTYDSYHSIHKPGEEGWETASFKDNSLYENATVINKDGKINVGFQGKGRKLNPTLSLPSVKERVTGILDTGVKFNSWFIDCDATGEIADDYSPKHTTTQEEDLKARLERMEYIRDEKNMVVGSEGGNDFASKTIAFAHGIETPAFSWIDPDMNKNKESKYYVGRYYSANGGVPEVFAKQIPVKDKYKRIFMDSTYTIPLYKLVYNDSVITAYHWLWGTFKVEDEVKNRMMYEVLYNVPPLYHVDKNEWEKHKEEMISHTKVWSDFSKKAITKEMTDFEILSEDRLVQMTKYGDDLKVIANFSDKSVNIEGNEIKGKSLIIFDGNNKTIYTP